MTVQGIYDLMTKTFGVHESNQRFDIHFYRAINNAQQAIAQKRKWGFLLSEGTITTTENERSAPMPDDFGKLVCGSGKFRISSPSSSSGGSIEFITAGRYMQNDFDSDATGTPSKMWIVGSNAYFTPIPDAVYVINMFYYSNPEEIINSDSDIAIPDRYAELFETLISKYLSRLGYSSITELQIDEQTVRSLFYQAIIDDDSRYGGSGMNLPPREYDRNIF